MKRPSLVPYWRRAWRFYSVRAAAALAIWNMLPRVLAEFIPDPLHIGISALLFGSVVLGAVVRQPDVDNQGDL